MKEKTELLIAEMILLALKKNPKSIKRLVDLSIQYGKSFGLTKEMVDKVLDLKLVDLIEKPLEEADDEVLGAKGASAAGRRQ